MADILSRGGGGWVKMFSARCQFLSGHNMLNLFESVSKSKTIQSKATISNLIVLRKGLYLIHFSEFTQYPYQNKWHSVIGFVVQQLLVPTGQCDKKPREPFIGSQPKGISPARSLWFHILDIWETRNNPIKLTSLWNTNMICCFAVAMLATRK